MKRVFSFTLAFFLILILLATLIVGLFGGPDGAPLLRTLIFIGITIPVVICGLLLITHHTRR